MAYKDKLPPKRRTFLVLMDEDLYEAFEDYRHGVQKTAKRNVTKRELVEQGIRLLIGK